MHYLFLLLSSCVMAFAMGLMQFYVLEVFVNLYSTSARDSIIQLISAVVTLGTVIVYPFSGPLAASVRKSYVMAVSAWVAAAIFVLGAALHWQPSAWSYLAAMGILIGCYNAGKMSSVPLVAKESHWSTATINGIMSVLFLVGLLCGIPCGTLLYTLTRQYDCVTAGGMLIAGLLVLAGVFASCCRCTNDQPRTFAVEQRRVLHDTWILFRRHGAFLTSGPLIWGVANAAQLATIALLVQRHVASTQGAAFVPLWAALGAISGTLFSPLLNRWRYTAATISALLMALLLPFVPVLANQYALVIGGVILMGILFGVATNLIDSTLLERVGAEGREGTGAAMQSAMLALFMVTASGVVGLCLSRHWISAETQFLVLTGFTLIAVVMAGGLALCNEVAPARVLSMCAPWLRWLLALRYDIRVTGLDKLGARRGTLILANHPAEMDPVILETLLWRGLRPRPVMTEDFFEVGALRWLFVWLRALPVPNLETGRSTFKLRRLAQTMEAICTGLRAGDNILLYPAGGLVRDGQTRIGGASATQTILQNMPDVPVLLVRTRGMWGSSFSWVYRGGRPDLFGCLAHGLRVLLQNLLVFTPRRRVEISIEDAPAQLPRTAERAAVNAWLEAWFNVPGPEPVSAVRYARWSARMPEIRGVNAAPPVDLAALPAAIVTGVREELARMKKCAPGDLALDMSLRNELGFDSLEMAEVLAWLDTRFDVRDATILDLTTVGAIMALVAGRTAQAAATTVPAHVAGWAERMPRGDVREPEGATIQEAFLRVCDRMPSAVACADDMAGVLTYRRLKTAALLLAEVLQEWPEERVGIMLPASVAADMCVLGVLLAGKTPVMINWTVGERTVRHVLHSSGATRIVTSRRFVDNVDSLPFDAIEPALVFLEDLRRERFTTSVKVLAALRARGAWRRTMFRLGLDAIQPDACAVILYTSGSETLPKGVPLTHANILENIRAVYRSLTLVSDNVLYAFLPPFHSFGLLTMQMPLVCGMKMAHYPNPTEARQLAQGIGRWQPTLLAGTPTFLKAILTAGTREQLASLRLLVTGAEKAPQALFDLVAQRTHAHAQILEGYGITECAPIVALNRPGTPAEGVGAAVPGVTLRIVQAETHQPLPTGTTGLILVSGPNVFNGYLDAPAQHPFIEQDGVRWYNTGDLGYLTPRGNLVIAGRLKRFVKIAGEMISLPALEEILLAQWPHRDDGPSLAVVARDIEGQRPELVLFAACDIDVADANRVMQAAGMSTLARLQRVVRLDKLPVLGTGKTDYRTLQAMLPG
ncbi:MAG: MFS transporter [bacterium]|nr:MFS transporter [bacterium]